MAEAAAAGKLDTPELTEEHRMRLDLVAGKRAQAVALMHEHELDCWLTFQREGSDPLLPFVMGGDYLVGTSGLMLFADGPSVAVVSDSDMSQVEGAFDRVVSYSTIRASQSRACSVSASRLGSASTSASSTTASTA